MKKQDKSMTKAMVVENIRSNIKELKEECLERQGDLERGSSFARNNIGAQNRTKDSWHVLVTCEESKVQLAFLSGMIRGMSMAEEIIEEIEAVMDKEQDI